MNKGELVEKIPEGTDITKASASRALDCLIDAVTAELASGGDVALVSFGTYKVNNRAAHTGRNPQTGREIQFAAAKTPTLKAVKALIDAVSG